MKTVHVDCNIVIKAGVNLHLWGCSEALWQRISAEGRALTVHKAGTELLILSQGNQLHGRIRRQKAQTPSELLSLSFQEGKVFQFHSKRGKQSHNKAFLALGPRNPGLYPPSQSTNRPTYLQRPCCQVRNSGQEHRQNHSCYSFGITLVYRTTEINI